MKNSKGETLPQPYYDLARMRREQQDGKGDDINEFSCFFWDETPERGSWWHEVYKGNTTDIPASSLAELEAWRKSREENKQSEFWGKAAMVADELRPDEPDYKAMYESEKEKAEYYESQYNVLKDAVITPTAELQSTDRNWIAECSMRVLAAAEISIEHAWDAAEKWAAEGKKRGRIS